MNDTATRTRGACAADGCRETDALLYDFDGDLLCAECYRPRAQARSRRYEQPCDECGRAPAWRDPKTRKNEYFCSHCHVARGVVPFPALAPRLSEPLSPESRPVCVARNYGTECRGQVKPRGKLGELCDGHANPKKPRS